MLNQIKKQKKNGESVKDFKIKLDDSRKKMVWERL